MYVLNTWVKGLKAICRFILNNDQAHTTRRVQIICCLVHLSLHVGNTDTGGNKVAL